MGCGLCIFWQQYYCYSDIRTTCNHCITNEENIVKECTVIESTHCIDKAVLCLGNIEHVSKEAFLSVLLDTLK